MRENCHGDSKQHCCCYLPVDCNSIPGYRIIVVPSAINIVVYGDTWENIIKEATLAMENPPEEDNGKRT